MLSFILRRLAWFCPSLVLASMLSFFVIELPPGDFVTAYEAQAATTRETVSPAQLAAMRAELGLDKPFVLRYATWIGNVLQGHLGRSLEYRAQVADLIGPRLGYTALVSFLTLLFIWALALPIGIYVAVNRYSVSDYAVTFFGFLGLATPSFLLALFMLYISTAWWGASVGGLFSPQFQDAPWSLARAGDLASKIWIPVVVLGTAGMASLIRIMRANLLDELHKPYVATARSKGLSEMRLILKYPVRLSITPFVSTIAWVLPTLISGELIVSSVLNLPTAGPLLLSALRAQDIYLAGALLLFKCVLVLVGTLVSDILLALIDPRIRLA